MTDVFISYSRKDKTFVRRLFDALEANDLDVWVDWDDIPPSVDWMTEILGGIENSNYFIFVITPDSVHSKIAYAELEHAVTHHKILLPLLHRDVKLTRRRGSTDIALNETLNPLDRAYSALGFESDADRVVAQLSPHNWIMFREEDDFDASVRTLLDAMSTDIEYVREHTRLLVRAREWENKDRDHSFLLTDAAISEAEAWLKRGESIEPKPTDVHKAYIHASRLRQLQEEQKKMALEQHAANRLRYLSMVMAFFLLASVVLSVFAFRERTAANNARATSDANLEFAVKTGATAERRAIEAESFVLSERALLALDNGNLLLGLALAMEAINMERPIPAAEAIFSEAAYGSPRRRLETPGSWVLQMDYLPDGQHMAVADANRTAMVWDIQTGEVLHTYEGHEGIVSSVAVSPDGKKLLSGSWDSTAILWDIENGAILQTLAHDGSVTQVEFSADGQQAITTACRDVEIDVLNCEFTVSVWDAASGELLGSFSSEAAIRLGAISPDGQFVAGADHETPGGIFVWDAQTGEEVLFLETFDPVAALAFSQDSTLLAVGDESNTLNIIDISTGEEIGVIYTFGAQMNSLSFRENKSIVLIGYVDGSAGELNYETVQQISSFSGQDDDITDIISSPNSGQLLVASQDGTVLIWDRRPGGMASDRIVVGDFAAAKAALLLPDEQHSLIILESGEIMRVDFSEGSSELISTLDVNSVDRALFSPDGTRVLVWADPSRLSIWEVETGEEVLVLTEHQTLLALSAAFSPDGKYLLTFFPGETIALRDASTGEILRNFEDIGVRGLSFAFAPDGKTALAGTNPGRVYVLDLENGTIMHNFTTIQQAPDKIVISPDGKSVLTVDTNDSFILQWDIATGKLLHRFEGHTDDITDVAFLPSGDQFMSTSADTSVLIWSIAGGAPIRRLYGQLDIVSGLDVGDSGNRVMSFGESGGLVLWEIQSLDELIEWTCENRAVRDLTEEERVSYGITSSGAMNLCDRYVESTAAPTEESPAAENGDATAAPE